MSNNDSNKEQPQQLYWQKSGFQSAGFQKSAGNASMADEFCRFRISLLTSIGRRCFPEGIWAVNPDPLNQDLYLTFDDGPEPDTTPRLLELLAKEQVKATFFLLGNRAAKHPELVQAIGEGGHTIGNHTNNHQFMPLLSVKSMEKEISECNQRINDASGFSPVLFRPPYGMLDARASDCLKERGMKPVYWSAVSEDWLHIGSERVVSRTMHQAFPGALLVLHEGAHIADQTIRSTREIIRIGRERGFSFKNLANH